MSTDRPGFVHLSVHTEYSLVDGLVKVKPLVKALKDPDERTGWIAAWALGEIGSEAKKAVPVLEALLEKYADAGIENIEDISILNVPPVADFGTPIEIVRAFGGKKKFVEAVHQRNIGVGTCLAEAVGEDQEGDVLPVAAGLAAQEGDVLVLVVLLTGLLLALPNIYGSVPAVQIAAGDGGAVDLGFEHLDHHGRDSSLSVGSFSRSPSRTSASSALVEVRTMGPCRVQTSAA